MHEFTNWLKYRDNGLSNVQSRMRHLYHILQKTQKVSQRRGQKDKRARLEEKTSTGHGSATMFMNYKSSDWLNKIKPLNIVARRYS